MTDKSTEIAHTSAFILLVLFLCLIAACSVSAQDVTPMPTPIRYSTMVPDSNGVLVEQCLIKGNINSKKDHIYHLPGWRDYAKTKIDLSKGERWFCTTEEAKAAGWRAPKNY